MELNIAAKNYTEEQREEINGITERQYRKMLSEGKYKDLLIKFGQNGNYSISNLLYLLAQNSDITVVKGMNEWERVGRHIKEGAQNMEIMAPTKVKYSVRATVRNSTRTAYKSCGKESGRKDFIRIMCSILRTRRAKNTLRTRSEKLQIRRNVSFLTVS